MNERIKELYGQAALVVFGYKVDVEGPNETLQKAINEKFAELIIKECMDIAKTREDEFESAGLLDESNAVGNVAYRISRQFGVKR
jgi:hypothetical protein